LAFVIGFVAIVASAQEPPGTVSVTDVVSGQQQWLDRFASIRVRWRKWNRADVEQYHPEVPPDATLENSPVYSSREFSWKDTGGLTFESVDFRGGKVARRNIYGTDSERFWDADAKTEGDFSQWEHVKLSRGNPEHPLKTALTMVAIYGLWDCSGEWLAERLQNADPLEILGSEVVDGHECAVVRIVHNESGSSDRETFWLDPSKNFLPRKFELVSKRPTASWSRTWTADQFREVEEGFFFPVRGVLAVSSSEPPGFEWLVEEVELNPAFPAGHFKPRVSAGTRVTDYIHGKAYATESGEFNADTESPSPRAANASARPAATGSPAVAVAPSFPWLRIIGGAALVLCGLLLLKWWTVARRSRGV
jgi:hypothetical protein